eukprot:tig00000404_g376.t1
MRVDRRKHIRKILQWYRISFGFEAPFNILVDGPFIQAALKGKIFLKEQLPKLCEDRAYPDILLCILQDIRKRGEAFGGAAVIAKNFTSIKCSHAAPVSGAECIASLIEDRAGEKYMVGSQEEEMQRRVRKVGGVPLIRISNHTLVVEKPSNESRDMHSKMEKAKGLPAKHEKAAWERMQKAPVPAPAAAAVAPAAEGGAEAGAEGGEAPAEAAAAAPAAAGSGTKPKPGKRKRAKGPNPLSCKKKAKADAKPDPKQASAAAAASASEAEGDGGEGASKAEADKPKRKRKRRRKAKAGAGPAQAGSDGGELEAGAEEEADEGSGGEASE